MPSSGLLSTKENFNAPENFNEMVRRQRSRINLIRKSALFPQLCPMERKLLTTEMENLVDEHEALRRLEN